MASRSVSELQDNTKNIGNAEIFLLGFHVSPEGGRFYDRFRLVPIASGFAGDMHRLKIAETQGQRFKITGEPDGVRLHLSLTCEETGEAETLVIETDAGNDTTGQPALLTRLKDDAQSAYVVETVLPIGLNPSPTHGWGTIAMRAIAADQTVVVVSGPVSEFQTPYSFRTNNGRHVEPTGYGHFVNHACEPSCRIEYRPDGRPVLVANRDLVPGDEITFDYTLTEGDLAGSFQCRCPAEVHKV